VLREIADWAFWQIPEETLTRPEFEDALEDRFYGAGFLMTFVADVLLALLVQRGLAGTRRPSGACDVLDRVAWVGALWALLGVTILMSPIPPALATGTPRRVLLALGSLSAAGCLCVVSARPRAES
jgi:hypothetical protein